MNRESQSEARKVAHVKGAIWTPVSSNSLGILFCVLLACQFGLQPILVKKFQSKEINPSSIVLTTELFKLIIVGVLLSTRESPSTLKEIWSKLTKTSSLKYIEWLRLSHGQ